MGHKDTRTKLLIVDDDPSVRRGLSSIFEATGDIQVVGLASDGVEAVTMSRKFEPDVVLMDLSMPNMDGMDATRFLLRSCPSVNPV